MSDRLSVGFLLSSIRSKIFGFIGFSGWLLIPILILENRVAVTVNGSNTALDFLQIITVFFWLITKLETHVRIWWIRLFSKQDTPGIW